MSGSRLRYWKYTLYAKGVLNSFSAEIQREGALIRDAGGGVGCVHPWPELGDAPLDEQLAALASELPTNLGEQALLCVEADGLARREGRNLFAPLRVPPSHWTAGVEPAEPPEGFAAIKLKRIDQIPFYREACPNHRLRLDLNDSLSVEAFRDFWRGLDAATREAIEFVEDPVPWDPDVWRELRTGWGVPRAADRDVMTRASEAEWLVVKPAVVNPIGPGELAWRENKRLVFTSYMDHAIGQLHAAWRAAEAAAILGGTVAEGGLVTHPLFEPDPFFDRLTCDGARLVPPEGTGLGFDDLLEDLPWKVLI